MEPVTPGVGEAPLLSLPGAVVVPGPAVLPVPGPPIDVVSAVLPGVVEEPLMLPVVEAVLPEVLVLSVDPVEPVELVDVEGMVSVVVDDVEGVGGSAGLLQAPRESAAVTAMIAAAVWVMVRFMKILLNGFVQCKTQL